MVYEREVPFELRVQQTDAAQTDAEAKAGAAAEAAAARVRAMAVCRPPPSGLRDCGCTVKFPDGKKIYSSFVLCVAKALEIEPTEILDKMKITDNYEFSRSQMSKAAEEFHFQAFVENPLDHERHFGSYMEPKKIYLYLVDTHYQLIEKNE